MINSFMMIVGEGILCVFFFVCAYEVSAVCIAGISLSFLSAEKYSLMKIERKSTTKSGTHRFSPFVIFFPSTHAPHSHSSSPLSSINRWCTSDVWLTAAATRFACRRYTVKWNLPATHHKSDGKQFTFEAAWNYVHTAEPMKAEKNNTQTSQVGLNMQERLQFLAVQLKKHRAQS